VNLRADLPAPGQGERRAAARGVAWGGVESAAGVVAGLVLTPLVVQSTGLAGLGLWGAAWSLAHTAGLLDLGVGAAYGRFASRALARRDLDELNGILAAGTGFHIALSILIGLPALLLAPRLLEWVARDGPPLPEARIVLTATILTVLMRGALSAYRGVVAGAQRADLLGRLGAVVVLLEGCGGAAVLLCGLGLRGLAINSLVAGIGASLAEGILAHRLCPGLRLRPFLATGEQFRRVLAFGSQLQATRAFEVLSSHVPRLVLAAGPGLVAAGAYDLGARLAAGVPVLASLPLRVITPLTGHLDARADRVRLQALLMRSTRYVAILSLPVLALVLLDAETILLAWTGRDAPPSAAFAARCLAAAAAATLAASPLRLMLRGCGRPGIEALATGGGTVLHLGLAFVLASHHGAAGVAFAALPGAAASLTLLAAGALRSGTALDPRAVALALLGPATAAAAMLLAGWILAQTSWTALPAHGASRLEALSLLVRRLPFLAAAFLAAGAPLGVLRGEDLALLREAAGGTTGARVAR
jgi:O-antigen/teichoic acid export membrane protein